MLGRVGVLGHSGITGHADVIDHVGVIPGMAAESNPLEAAALAIFDPSDLGELLKPYDYSTLYQTDDTSTPCTADGQPVGRCEGQRSIALVNAAAGQRMTTITEGGFSGIHSSTTNDYLWGAFGSTTNQPVTVAFQIYARNPLGAGSSNFFGGMFDAPGGITKYALTYSSSKKHTIYAGMSVSGSTFVADTVYYSVAQFDGASSGAYLDGSVDISGNAGTHGSLAGMMLGFNGASPCTEFIIGKSFMIDRILTAGERATLEAWLAVVGDA